jgi:hypothetical protein
MDEYSSGATENEYSSVSSVPLKGGRDLDETSSPDATETADLLDQQGPGPHNRLDGGQVDATPVRLAGTARPAEDAAYVLRRPEAEPHKGRWS